MIFEVKHSSSDKKFIKGSSEAHLKTKKEVREYLVYLFKEKMKNGDIDEHAGKEFSEFSVSVNMIDPMLMRRFGRFRNKEHEEEYILQYCEAVATQWEENVLNNPLRNGTGKNDNLAFRFISSFAEDELQHMDDEEKSTFINMTINRVLQRVSRSEEIIYQNIKSTHLKRDNPHGHATVNTVDKYGVYNPFFIGREGEGGMTDIFKQVKYELELEFPFLRRMETLNREAEFNEIQDAKILAHLQHIASHNMQENYSYEKVNKLLESAGLSVEFHRVNGIRKDIFISQIHNPKRKVSYKKLPLEIKRILELQDYFNLKMGKTGISLSQNATKAITIIKENPNLPFPELNDKLAKVGIHLNAKKNGKTVQWSFLFLDYNTTLSVNKLGLDTSSPELSEIFTKDAEKLHEILEISKKEKDSIAANYTGRQRIRGTGYDKNYIPYEEFRYQNEETALHFQQRMILANKTKTMLVNQIIDGNSIRSKYNQKVMFKRVADHEYQLLQSNQSSVKCLLQEVIARGDTTITFTGPDNQKMQEAIYIQAMLLGLTVSNYTPTATTAAKVKELQEARYAVLMADNIEKIDATLASAEPKPVKLRQDRQLDRTIDSRPALHGLLYGLWKRPEPHLWQMPAFAKDLTPQEVEDVARRFQQEAKLRNDELAALFSLSGFQAPAYLETIEQAQADPAAKAAPAATHQVQQPKQPKPGQKAPQETPKLDDQDHRRGKIKPT